MRYTLEGLDCANCAVKIENELKKNPGLEKVKVNFATKSIELPEELYAVAQEVIARLEPGVRLRKGRDEGETVVPKKHLPLWISGLLFLI
ncbi:MAG: hypothetical protein GX073_00795, partial [Firmicutes bacterium]|nr:hypothetical protein [Bacillota bacterium]